MPKAELTGVWRKSTYSGNQSNCVEVARVWRKSTYSGNNTNCVEVSGVGRQFAVRDTKDRSGPVLAFGAAEWSAFLAWLK